jgi:hypothetical protein
MIENIEKILNAKKIRYEYMDNLFRKYKSVLAEGSVINIFIDLASTIKQLYNPESIKGLSGIVNKKDKYAISSILLNMIGHYRHYFASRHRCYTNIIFMYNSKIDNQIKDINPDYKKTYYEKRFLLDNPVFSDLNLLLKDNYKMMKTIIEYLPNVSFADSSYCDYRSIFPFMIEKEEFKNNLNIILTTDKQMYQNTLLGETIILEPRGDKSRIITSNYIIKILLGKSKTIEKHPDYLTINPENVILIESLISHKDLDTTGIKNFSYLKAVAFLCKNNIDINKIIFNIASINELFKDILTEEELNKVIENFKIYNNFYLASKYENDLNIMYPSFIKSINDYSELKKVNETLYSKNPLTLDFFFDGE